jgi:transposase
LKTDFDGYPIAFDLTGGEKGDAPHFPILLGLGPDIDPRAAIGDKGYASRANREAARNRGAIAVIPRKANEKAKPAFFPKALYKGRGRIEQAVGKLKRFKRIALRCEKTAANFASFVALAAGFILIKSVHTA